MSNMNKPGIYVITHTASGKRYVGSATNIRIRWNKHRRELRGQIHHNSKLRRAWNKHGADAFMFTVLEDTADLLPREQHWMDRLEVVGAKGYNLSPVAGTPMPPGPRRPHSEETKAKIRAKRALQIMDPAAMAKLHAANRDRPRTPEVRAAISASHTGKKLSAEHRAAIVKSRTGTTIPAEVRARMSASLKGHVKSPEHCANLSKALTGKRLSAETIAKRTASRRANGNY